MNRIAKGLIHPLRAARYVMRKARFRMGYAPPVQSINVQPTMACNLKCRMCMQHLLLDRKSEYFRVMLKMDHLVRLLDDLGELRPAITLIGGEPMMHPQIREMVTEIKRRNLPLSIQTNGLRLAENADFFIASGVDHISVSLDGNQEINDANRGNGTFDRAVAGIEALLKIRQERNGQSRIGIVATVSDLTYARLSDVADLALSLGVHSVVVSHLTFYNEPETKAQVEESRRRLRKCLGEKLEESVSVFDKYRDCPIGKIDALVLVEQLAIMHEKLNGNIAFSTTPGYPDEEVVRYYTDPYYRRPSRNPCNCVYQTITLASTGDFVQCLGQDYGNIEQRRFKDVWNGPASRRFRREVYFGGRFPVCERCCC